MDILKAEILKLGGNDEDFELVKNVEDPEVARETKCVDRSDQGK